MTASGKNAPLQLKANTPRMEPRLAFADLETPLRVMSLEEAWQLTQSGRVVVLVPATSQARETQHLSMREVGGDFAFGDVRVSFSSMEVSRLGKPVVLTALEYKTLAYFLRNPRRVVSRDELLNEVWGYRSYPRTRTVDNHVMRLRQKLERDPSQPAHFRTMHGTGYKFLP